MKARSTMVAICLSAACAFGGPSLSAQPIDGALARPSAELLKQQVEAAERAFAKSMADRDHAAFVALLSEEAIFFSGATALRGREAVAEAWSAFFRGDQAPFSWEPETIEVLDSGALALSTGPVRDPEGGVVAAFTSIWRQEAPGVWRIVFDKGCPICPPP